MWGKALGATSKAKKKYSYETGSAAGASRRRARGKGADSAATEAGATSIPRRRTTATCGR